jgi:transposase-like protein
MRRKFVESDKQRYLAELKESGETPWRFARRVGISPGTLYRWMKTRTAQPTPRFARLVPERRSAGANTVLPSGVSIRVGEARVEVESGFDAELLRAVLDVLSDGGTP